jgi:cytochrome b561
VTIDRAIRHAGGSATDGWTPAVKTLHWLVTGLIVVQVALGFTAAAWHLSPAKLDLFVWHKSLGMMILALAAVRLAVRATHRAPPLPGAMPRWERRAARVSHVLLYVLIVALPLSGWVVNSAANVPVRLFWLVPLPSIVPPSKALEAIAMRTHLALVVALGALVAIHVGAALRHHVALRDDVLRRMLPATRPR